MLLDSNESRAVLLCGFTMSGEARPTILSIRWFPLSTRHVPHCHGKVEAGFPRVLRSKRRRLMTLGAAQHSGNDTGSIRGTSLFSHLLEVRFDSVFANPQLIRDFFIRHALYEMGHAGSFPFA